MKSGCMENSTAAELICTQDSPQRGYTGCRGWTVHTVYGIQSLVPQCGIHTKEHLPCGCPSLSTRTASTVQYWTVHNMNFICIVCTVDMYSLYALICPDVEKGNLDRFRSVKRASQSIIDLVHFFWRLYLLFSLLSIARRWRKRVNCLQCKLYTGHIVTTLTCM